jgi:hypothetical protein
VPPGTQQHLRQQCQAGQTQGPDEPLLQGRDAPLLQLPLAQPGQRILQALPDQARGAEPEQAAAGQGGHALEGGQIETRHDHVALRVLHIAGGAALVVGHRNQSASLLPHADG